MLPDQLGPRRLHKLSDEVVETLQTPKSEQPEPTAVDLVESVHTRFGISVHRRSIDRALGRGKITPMMRRAPGGGAARLRTGPRADACHAIKPGAGHDRHGLAVVALRGVAA